jgi:multiple sugar transport system substrate-binding protein
MRLNRLLSRRPLGRRAAILGSGAGLATLLAAPQPSRAAERLTYWHCFTSQSEFAGLQRILAQFGKVAPDIAVAQENIPNPSFMAKFTSAVVSGSRPDTVMILSERIDDMVAMEGLIDLSSRVKAWNQKPNFPDTAWNAITRAGGIYGVPAFTFVDWMYYRKDWFDQAGIAGPPKTLDEFATMAQKLTDPAKGRYGFGMRGGAGGTTYLMYVFGSYGSFKVTDGKPSLDRKSAIEALRFYTDLYTKAKAVPQSAPGDSYRQVMEGFRTGQTAMIWHHTGSLVEISQALKPGEQFMSAAMPAGPATRFARVSYAYNGLMTTTHADPSWQWVSFWGETEPAIALLQETGYFPASRIVAKDPRIADNPIYQPAVETLGFGQVQPSFVGMPDWSDNVVLPALQSVLVGRSTVEQAVDSMRQGLDKAAN